MKGGCCNTKKREKHVFNDEDLGPVAAFLYGFTGEVKAKETETEEWSMLSSNLGGK